MSAITGDQVEAEIQAGAQRWVPDAAPAAPMFECIACATRVPRDQVRRDRLTAGDLCLVCQACGTYHKASHVAPLAAAAELAAAEVRALEAAEAPAPRPGALLGALCAMLRAFPDARNHEQARAIADGLAALDGLSGMAAPAHVVELARAVDCLDRLRQARDAGRGDSDALNDAHAWIMVASRRLVRGVEGWQP